MGIVYAGVLVHVSQELLDLLLVGLVQLAQGLAGQTGEVQTLSLQGVLADLLPVRYAVHLVVEEVVDLGLDVVLSLDGGLYIARLSGVQQSTALLGQHSGETG